MFGRLEVYSDRLSNHHPSTNQVHSPPGHARWRNCVAMQLDVAELRGNAVGFCLPPGLSILGSREPRVRRSRDPGKPFERPPGARSEPSGNPLGAFRRPAESQSTEASSLPCPVGVGGCPEGHAISPRPPLPPPHARPARPPGRPGSPGRRGEGGGRMARSPPPN